MRMQARLIAISMIALFMVASFGCSMSDVAGLSDGKLGKYAESKTVSKDKLDDKIKTQWGTIELTSSQIAKIKKLKNVKNLKSAKSVKKYTYNITCKTSKGKRVEVAINYIGGGSYKLSMVKVK